MTGLALIGAVLLLAANAFFVAIEFALISSRSVKLEPMVAEGRRGSKRALASMGDLQRQLGGAQLGITLASLALGLLAEPAVATLVEPVVEALRMPHDAIHPIALVISLGLVAMLHILVGEMVPKNMAIAHPEESLLLLAPVHHLFVSPLGPIISSMNNISSVVVRALGYEVVDELMTANTASEFERIVDASHREGLIEELGHTMLSGALDFAGRPASTVLVQRESLVTVNRRMTVGEIEQVIVSSGHSRLPVVGVGVDDVLGFIHAKDLLRLPPEAREEPIPLELIRRLLVVPDTSPLEFLLLTMRRNRSHIAVVRDASGATVGVVTLEDIVEELVGEIRDESDTEASGQ